MGVADGNIEVLPFLNGGLDKLDGIPGAKTPDGKRTDSGCFDPAPKQFTLEISCQHSVPSLAYTFVPVTTAANALEQYPIGL